MKKIYKQEEVIAFLEEYYRKLENKEVKVSVRESDAGPFTTYSFWVSDVAPSDGIEIAGVQIPLGDKKEENYLPDNKVEEMLSALFELHGLKLNSFQPEQKETFTTGPNPIYEFLGYSLDIERKNNLERK